MQEEGPQHHLDVEVTRLRMQLERLNSHRFIRSLNHPVRALWWRFLNGLVFGLGTVLGGSILLSLLIYMLSSINFIPVIGEWAAEIVKEIQAAQ